MRKGVCSLGKRQYSLLHWRGHHCCCWGGVHRLGGEKGAIRRGFCACFEEKGLSGKKRGETNNLREESASDAITQGYPPKGGKGGTTKPSDSFQEITH